MKNQKVYIVVPVFNESQQIVESMLADLHFHGYQHIILVDDGSECPVDHNLLSRENVMVVRHAINRGKGAAVKTGIAVATQKGARVVVTIDGDGQHDPQDIQLLLDKIEEGYDVVLGSRFAQENAIPHHKRVANYLGNVLTWVFFGLWVEDSQSGLRAYSERAIHLIDTQSDRYAYDSEIVREIKKHSLRFCEVPIHVRYTEYAMNKQTRQTVMGGLKTLFHFFHIR